MDALTRYPNTTAFQLRRSSLDTRTIPSPSPIENGKQVFFYRRGYTDEVTLRPSDTSPTPRGCTVRSHTMCRYSAQPVLGAGPPSTLCPPRLLRLAPRRRRAARRRSPRGPSSTLRWRQSMHITKIPPPPPPFPNLPHSLLRPLVHPSPIRI